MRAASAPARDWTAPTPELRLAKRHPGSSVCAHPIEFHPWLIAQRRGHLGGLLGGAAVALLLGPAYEVCRVKGQPGVWLFDDPPVAALAAPPRKLSELGGRRRRG